METQMEWYFKVLKQYAVFEGRARRKEYWVFILVHSLVYIAMALIDMLLNLTPTIAVIYSLATLLPYLAVSVRRLHDTGRSGWWILISFIPLIGLIAIIIFLTQDSTENTNEYGVSPKLVQA